MVPNPGFKWDYNERTGYRIQTRHEPHLMPASVRKLSKNSPVNKAATIFNKLPRELKYKTDDSIESYKAKLDKFLQCVPDEPDSIRRAAQSNSLVNQIDYRQ